MCCKGFWKRIVSFGLTLSLGLIIAAIWQSANSADKTQTVEKAVYVNEVPPRSWVCNRNNYSKDLSEKPAKPVGPTEGVKVLSKPRAIYTDAARANFTQGKVVLRATFSKNGTIGAVSVISGLPDGLTEQAIEAVKGIKFEPAMRDGVPYSVTKPVEYTFTIF